MDVTSIINYLDIAFITILILGCIIGFCRGMFKSTYNFIVFIVLIISGWFLSKMFVNTILDAKLNITIGDVYITSLRESIPEIVSNINADFGKLMVEGTEAYELVIDLSVMVTRLLFMIIWLVLMFTIFKFIFWIIYLIVKPKKKNEDGSKKKKKFTSRLGGTLIGAVHTAVILLIICVPVSGICSIGSELASINDKEVVYTTVPTKDGKIILLDADVDINPNDNSEYFSIYRKSSFGKFYGMIKIGDTSVDEKIFDNVFSFEYNANKVYLKSELTTVLDVYNKLNNRLEGTDITFENIMNLEEDFLYELVDEISNLKLISVAIPIGTEYLVNSESFKNEYSDLLGEDGGKDLIEKVKKVNCQDDFVNLGKGFIDITKSGLLSAFKEKDSEGNPLSIIAIINKIDNDHFEKACEKIGDVQLLDAVGDLGLKYVLKSDVVKKYLESANLTINDINLDNIKLSDEISSLGKVLVKVQDLELPDSEDIDITKISDNSINLLIDALYDVKIFNQNTRLVVSVVREELMPEEYRAVLPDKEMNSNDLKSVVKVAKVMLKASKVSDGKTVININDLLSSENIELLKEEAKNSEFLAEVVNGAGEVLINTICNSFGISKEEINLDGVSWVEELDTFKALIDICNDLGIDINNPSAEKINIEKFTDEEIEKLANAVFNSNVMKNNTELILTILKKNIGDDLQNYVPKSLANKEELVSFMKLAKTIASTAKDGKIDISTIDKDEITGALEGLSSENIDNLLTGIIEGTGIISKDNINLPKIDPSTEEGKEEIKKALEAMDVISSMEDITSIKQIREDEINSITSSSIATSVVVSILEEQTKEGGALNGFLSLDDINDDEWVDKDGQSGELKKLLNATSIIMDEDGNANVTPDTITNLTDDDISTITDSKVIINSLEKNMNDLLEDTINNAFNKEELGFDINLGTVETKDGETKQEAWKKEISTIRDITSLTNDIDPNNTDLSDKETSEKIGNLLNSSKDSQILGETSISLASALLESGYEKVEGQDAPKVDKNTDFAAEFAKLQALLNK